MVRYIKDDALFYKMNNINDEKREYLSLRDFYSIIMGLLPVIMIYRVPFLGKGLSTVLLVLFIPYVLIRFFQGNPRKTWKILLPVCIGFAYLKVRSIGEVSVCLTMIVAMIHIMGATQNTINARVMRKTIEVASIISSVMIIVQTVIFYLFDKDIKFISSGVVLRDLAWDFIPHTKGFYRPSGLFSEPSHMAQYACIALASFIMPEDNKKIDKKVLRKAVLVALGILLSTSGMGLVLCVCIVMYTLIINAFSMDFKRGISTLFAIMFGSVLFVAVAIRMPIIKTAFERIVGEVDGYNAIHGRVLFYDIVIGGLEKTELIWGRGTFEIPEVYMTGYMQTVYTYGYVGIGIICLMVALAGIICGKNRFVWCVTLIFTGLLFVANNISFIKLCFWFSFVYTYAAGKLMEVKEKPMVKFDIKHSSLIRTHLR